MYYYQTLETRTHTHTNNIRTLCEVVNAERAIQVAPYI